jgi:hypothetical protein
MQSDDKENFLDYLKSIFETASEGIFFVDTNGQTFTIRLPSSE